MYEAHIYTEMYKIFEVEYGFQTKDTNPRSIQLKSFIFNNMKRHPLLMNPRINYLVSRTTRIYFPTDSRTQTERFDPLVTIIVTSPYDPRSGSSPVST